MPKRILDVGQCGPDHATITSYLTEHFDCQIVQTHALEDTLAALKSSAFDLVLINRKLDRDYSDGVDIIKEIKADPQIVDVPVMLVTNYPEHQQAAIASGAVMGFGKLEYEKPETLARLKAVLAA